MVNVTGNDLVFVFKKRGVGHHGAGAERPTPDQTNAFHKLLLSKGFSNKAAQEVRFGLHKRTMWDATEVDEMLTALADLDRAGVEAWLAERTP